MYSPNMSVVASARGTRHAWRSLGSLGWCLRVVDLDEHKVIDRRNISPDGADWRSILGSYLKVERVGEGIWL